MAISDLQVKRFSIGEGFHLDQNYMLYGKMFQPYEIERPSEWSVDDIYTVNERTSYDMTNFQQGNEVFAGTLVISNRGSSDITFDATIRFMQYKGGGWQEATTCTWYFDNIYLEGETSSEYWSWAGYIWAGVDPDEMRPGITQYRLDLYFDSTFKQSINFTASNRTFDTTVCNNGYMRVEGANLCYVAPSYYSGSSTTGYKIKCQYDTGYSGATGQTPGMIRVPESSTDYHIYYTTSNGVVRRTKNSYPRPYNPSTTYSSRKGHIRMTPSTSWSTEETGYNYVNYIDGGGHKRRLGPGEVT